MRIDRKALRKAMTKGVGKATGRKRLQWDDMWNQLIATDPCGLFLREGEKGEPIITTRTYTKRNAWVIEMLDRDSRQWAYSVMLNLEKEVTTNNTFFSHTLKWCMDKIEREKRFFEEGTFDKCEARLHNLSDDAIVMVAVLI